MLQPNQGSFQDFRITSSMSSPSARLYPIYQPTHWQLLPQKEITNQRQYQLRLTHQEELKSLPRMVKIFMGAAVVSE
jgi:hypothetical protein